MSDDEFYTPKLYNLKMSKQSVVVQDDERESQLIELLELIPNSNSRLGSDALKWGLEFELKTTTRRQVSTARDIGTHTVTKWSKYHWIIATGNNLSTGFHIIDIYYLSPRAMNEWLTKLYNKLERHELLSKKSLAANLNSGLFDEAEIKTLESIYKRGCTVNDQGIPMKYVEENGILLTAPYPVSLARAIDAPPPKPSKQILLSDFLSI